MPRNISFALTTQQFIEQTKTVTRRLRWWGLKQHDILCGVEKGMGLKKGEKVKRLGLIYIISASPEQLFSITQQECILEGFPEMSPVDFVEMFCLHNRCRPYSSVTRIQYAYLITKRLPMSYRKARYMGIYDDYSELVHLPAEKLYVWLRPNSDRTKMHEVEIDAKSDIEALAAVRERRMEEVGEKNEQSNQAMVQLYVLADCFKTRLQTHSFARVDIQQTLKEAVEDSIIAIRDWPGVTITL